MMMMIIAIISIYDYQKVKKINQSIKLFILNYIFLLELNGM